MSGLLRRQCLVFHTFTCGLSYARSCCLLHTSARKYFLLSRTPCWNAAVCRFHGRDAFPRPCLCILLIIVLLSGRMALSGYLQRPIHDLITRGGDICAVAAVHVVSEVGGVVGELRKSSRSTQSKWTDCPGLTCGASRPRRRKPRYRSRAKILIDLATHASNDQIAFRLC